MATPKEAVQALAATAYLVVIEEQEEEFAKLRQWKMREIRKNQKILELFNLSESGSAPRSRAPLTRQGVADQILKGRSGSV